MNEIIPQPSPAWPAWYYGPDDQAGIFQSPDEVPPGWMSNPSEYRKANGQEKDPAETGSDAKTDAGQEAEEEKVVRRRGRPPKVREEMF